MIAPRNALLVVPQPAVARVREEPPTGALFDVRGRVTNVSEASYGMNSYNIKLMTTLQADGIAASVDLKAPGEMGHLDYQGRVRILIYRDEP